jgi:hypothetical protein
VLGPLLAKVRHLTRRAASTEIAAALASYRATIAAVVGDGGSPMSVLWGSTKCYMHGASVAALRVSKDAAVGAGVTGVREGLTLTGWLTEIDTLCRTWPRTTLSPALRTRVDALLRDFGALNSYVLSAGCVAGSYPAHYVVRHAECEGWMTSYHFWTFGGAVLMDWWGLLRAVTLASHLCHTQVRGAPRLRAPATTPTPRRLLRPTPRLGPRTAA